MQANPVIGNKRFGGADRFRDEFLIYGVENLEPVRSDDTHLFFRVAILIHSCAMAFHVPQRVTARRFSGILEVSAVQTGGTVEG